LSLEAAGLAKAALLDLLELPTQEKPSDRSSPSINPSARRRQWLGGASGSHARRCVLGWSQGSRHFWVRNLPYPRIGPVPPLDALGRLEFKPPEPFGSWPSAAVRDRIPARRGLQTRSRLFRRLWWLSFRAYLHGSRAKC